MLKGVATKLADSFIASTNIDSIKNLPAEEVRIDLLSETIGPSLESRELGLAVMRYHSWFNAEVKKIEVDPTKVSSVTITLRRKPEGQKITYTCTVEIETTDRKRFSGQKTFSWNL